MRIVVQNPPRRRYSWEDEAADDGGDDAALEPARPDEVPVIWRRAPSDEAVVLRFRPRPVATPERPPEA